MNILISWSGGLDSTYLVWKALSEGHTVHTYSVEILNNRDQSAREMSARKRMKEYFDSKFPGKLDKVGLSKFECWGSRLTISQPSLWILFSFFAPVDNIDEIWVGYVMNDDALSYLDDIRHLYGAYKPFLWENAKLPNLIFPILKKKKSSLITEMPNELLDMITVCELSFTKGECGQCVSCEKNEESFRNSGKYHLCKSKKRSEEDSISCYKVVEEKKKSFSCVGTQGVLFTEDFFHTN